jgi:hypothetical protein
VRQSSAKREKRGEGKEKCYRIQSIAPPSLVDGNCAATRTGDEGRKQAKTTKQKEEKERMKKKIRSDYVVSFPQK